MQVDSTGGQRKERNNSPLTAAQRSNNAAHFKVVAAVAALPPISAPQHRGAELRVATRWTRGMGRQGEDKRVHPHNSDDESRPAERADILHRRQVNRRRFGHNAHAASATANDFQRSARPKRTRSTMRTEH